MKQRIGYIDTAKGLLILCLLFGHLRIIAREQGLDDPVLHLMSAGFGFYTPYFMQTFFLISGLCSTFRTGFGDFLKKHLKTLLLPALLLDLLGYGILACAGAAGEPFGAHVAGLAQWLATGGPWFIFALFWAKLLYWCLYKLPPGGRVAGVLGLFFIGLALDAGDWIPNVQWHRHALICLPWLLAGDWLKQHAEPLQRLLKPVGLAGIGLIALENILAHFTAFSIPALDYDIHVGFSDFPLHWVNVIGGSAFVLWAAKALAGSRTLALLGQGSLLAYLLNYALQVLVLRLLMPLYPAGQVAGCLLFHAASYLLCVALCCALIRLIYPHRALSWIVGKF